MIGERWTLLIVRELLLGPKRFTDLRERLDGMSPSVLTERLARVEELGLVRRATLPPPAACTVYELTEDGRALKPAILALIRWGERAHGRKSVTPGTVCAQGSRLIWPRCRKRRETESFSASGGGAPDHRADARAHPSAL